MNKDINIVLTEAETVATAVDFRDGLGRVLKTADVIYTFPWKKVGAVLRNNGAAAATSNYSFLPTAVSDGSVHSFYITQSTGDNESRTIQVSYTANASDDVDTVKAQLIVIINALESTGLIDVNLTDLGVGLALRIEGTATNPVAAVSGAQGGTILLPFAGSEAINAGADLAALGVVDSFDSSVIPTAALYNEYTFELMAPKGSGGFNEQTNDQKVLLKVYADQASLTSAALDAVIDSIIDGSYTAAELLGSNV